MTKKQFLKALQKQREALAKDEAFRAEYDSDTMFVAAWSPLASRLTAGSPEQEPTSDR